jgi:hypothetical protein
MDIVERLRSSLRPGNPYLLRNADIMEAAGEIERLRAALRPFADVVYNDNGDMTIKPCGINDYAKAYFTLNPSRG